ncbi:DUF3784 domain-containing protein [Clostridium sp. SHJSY1]|uniref:DUF3784 domain-containing protein n=1 Tax=Clostridium sp. SHJSY1 TaxID=2942483 RepID=UPI00287467EE|nr:DUF3784 domain-containing protein [Clostridium sp. SHJSY1]MDS0524343.1 DUF3784 domain-containing protein [Clostridium sp. SHJSY1]
MGGIILMISLDIIFVIISITLLRGKGSFLIAGYNTATEEEKRKYNETKLCKAMGICTLVVSIMLGILTFNIYQLETSNLTENSVIPFVWIFVIVIILDVIVTNIYIIKKCKHKR